MRLLIIGKLDGHMSEASKIASKRGVKVFNMRTIDDALRHVRMGKGADLAFLDVHLDFSRFLTQLKKERINLPVVACGLENESAEIAEEAIMLGAKDYMPLPPNAKLIAQMLETVAHKDYEIIHDDPKLKSVILLADRIAPTEASVLITGESGTGKEVFAHYIHHKSKRKEHPFVAINCAAIPESLLESELFGHEKGSFTGAATQRIGKFEEANGGTIFLDEITEMDLHLQAKLLRVLQEREITRLGGKGQIKVDVRILATSNRDLESTVKDGKFREDLYYRLNVINLHLPPLRERPRDIMALAHYFLGRYSQKYDRSMPSFHDEAVLKLTHYHWPGNVRELENTIHGALILSQEDEILPQNLNLSQKSQLHNETTTDETKANQNDKFTSDFTVGQSLAVAERTLILNTFHHCLGNQSETATLLGISIKDLQDRLNRYAEGKA